MNGFPYVPPLWHFDNPEAATLLRNEGNEWLGLDPATGQKVSEPTPFRKFGCAKGPGGGVYCVAFARAMMEASGACRPGEFKFPHDDGDYASANTMRRITKYLRGLGRLPAEEPGQLGTIDPESARLADIFAPVPVFRELRKHHARGPYNIDASLFMLGDLLLMREVGLFHIPVMLGGRKFVSAIPGIGVREGNLHDTTYSLHIAGAFRARHSSLITSH